MKILIADADPEATANLRQKLEATCEIRIKVANCGTDVWMILTSFHEGFDAAIIDLTLPDMDGVELLQRMRRLPELQSTPVIVCTAIRDRATVTRTLALGVRHYVIKPAAVDLVHEKLLDALQIVSSASSTQSQRE